MVGKINNVEPVAYVKTIREIAEEIGVSKQAVFKKINRQPLSTELDGLTSTVDGRLMVSVDGERLIKQAFGTANEDINHQPSTVNQVDDVVDSLEVENEDKSQVFISTEKVNKDSYDDKSEVLFLRKQIEQMNEQLSRRDTMIDSLNRELENEREHNREKDRQLLDTLSKLAESQAALSAGQSADKQRELAKTLLEGQQKIGNGRSEAVEEDLKIQQQKEGWLRRVWNAIAGKK